MVCEERLQGSSHHSDPQCLSRRVLAHIIRISDDNRRARAHGKVQNREEYAVGDGAETVVDGDGQPERPDDHGASQ